MCWILFTTLRWTRPFISVLSWVCRSVTPCFLNGATHRQFVIECVMLGSQFQGNYNLFTRAHSYPVECLNCTTPAASNTVRSLIKPNATVTSRLTASSYKVFPIWVKCRSIKKINSPVHSSSCLEPGSGSCVQLHQWTHCTFCWKAMWLDKDRE
jgi:hypothetical protein